MREFKADFETPEHGVENASVTARPDAVSSDYLTRFVPGPRGIGDAATGHYVRAWRVRADHEAGEVLLAPANKAGRCSEENELLLLEFDPANALVHIGLAFDGDGVPHFVAERADGAVWLSRDAEPMELLVADALSPVASTYVDEDAGTVEVVLSYIRAAELRWRTSLDDYAAENATGIARTEHQRSESYAVDVAGILHLAHSTRDPVTGKYTLDWVSSSTELPLPVVSSGTPFVGSQDADCVERVGDEIYHVFTINSGSGSGIGRIQISASAPGGVREIDIGMRGGGGDGGGAPGASNGAPSGIWLDGAGNILSPGASITSVLHAPGGGAGGFSHNNGANGGGGGGGGAKGRAGAYSTLGGSQWGGRGRSSPGFFFDQPYASGGGGGSVSAGEPGTVAGNEAKGGRGGQAGIPSGGPLGGAGGNGTTGTDPDGEIGGGGGVGAGLKVEDLSVSAGGTVKVQAAGPVAGIGDGGNAGAKGRGGYVHVAEYIRTPLANPATLAGG